MIPAKTRLNLSLFYRACVRHPSPAVMDVPVVPRPGMGWSFEGSGTVKSAQGPCHSVLVSISAFTYTGCSSSFAYSTPCQFYLYFLSRWNRLPHERPVQFPVVGKHGSCWGGGGKRKKDLSSIVCLINPAVVHPMSSCLLFLISAVSRCSHALALSPPQSLGGEKGKHGRPMFCSLRTFKPFSHTHTCKTRVRKSLQQRQAFALDVLPHIKSDSCHNVDIIPALTSLFKY